MLEGSTVYSQPAAARASRPPKNDAAHAAGTDTFNVVYVNEIARAALSAAPRAAFPVGSIVVSEKLSKPDDAPPALVAVMVKRAQGFNPSSGDWEFLVVNGALTEVRKRQRKGSCVECHASQRDGDFFFPPATSK